MSEGVLVVIDSASTDNIVYGGGSHGSWSTQHGSHWFNNTSASSGTAGSINLTFTGNAIALYGRSPPLGESQMTVTIDEQESYETTLPPDHAGIYCQWWQSPTLHDGTHTIQLEGLSAVLLDFATVSVNKSSLKTRQQIIVDDNDASMMYRGVWSPQKHTSLKRNPTSLPFHNVTHKSDTIGASVSFNFTGSYIAVYGVIPAKATGSVTARYTLDFNTTTTKHGPPENSLQGRQNSLLYQRSLGAGSHTLLIEIEDVQNLAYNLDYVVYTYSPDVPSSSKSLSATPTLRSTSSSPSVAPPSSTSSSMTTTTTSSSASSSSSSIATEPTTVHITTSSLVSPSSLTSESQSITSSVPSPPPVSGPSSDIAARTGKIVGFTVGSVTILAALIAAILLWKRRCIRRRRHFLPIQTIDFSSNNGNPVATASRSRSPVPIQPFTLSEPAPGSRAVSETVNEKMDSLYSVNNPISIERVLHRRSWSGTSLRASLGDRETTLSPSIVENGKPPSYRA